MYAYRSIFISLFVTTGGTVRLAGQRKKLDLYYKALLERLVALETLQARRHGAVAAQGHSHLEALAREALAGHEDAAAAVVPGHLFQKRVAAAAGGPGGLLREEVRA